MIDRTAYALTSSAGRVASGSRSTLFGAVLEVRFGPQLASRLSGLLDKLNSITIREGVDVSLGDVYGAVCYMQYVLDNDAKLERGATRSLLAAMVGLEGVFADGKILQLLGREAAITYAGDRVYSRHPVIARSIVGLMGASGQTLRVAHLIGLAGGRLRMAGGVEDAVFRSAYMFGTEVKSEAVEAVAAGQAGSPWGPRSA